ncbi:MAG: hypothetical protein L6R37_004820 [Teloschistes peruensis]|nr:MAG: hypothetical protein L6R37_004820 [Teloschistes peruensis]
MATSLISLPDEIKLSILNAVGIGPENTLLALRRTHPWFRANTCTENIRTRLLAAEKDSKLVPPSHFVCYTCLRILPAEHFADNSTRSRRFQYDDLWDESGGGSLDGFDYEDLSDG